MRFGEYALARLHETDPQYAAVLDRVYEELAAEIDAQTHNGTQKANGVMTETETENVLYCCPC